MNLLVEHSYWCYLSWFGRLGRRPQLRDEGLGSNPIRANSVVQGAGGTVNREATSSGSARRRVLVVEDSEELVHFLAELLAVNSYEVVSARNGVEAMVALTAPESEAPHVVLLDLGLPLESGVSVLTFLRNVMQSGLPVIVLTGRRDPDEEAAVRQLGVSSYLRKPASPEQVLAAIARALA